MSNEIAKNGEILLYSYGDSKEYVDVFFKDETFWLTQSAMAELFDVNVPAVSKHLKNIYDEQELDRSSTVSKMETVQSEGNRSVKRMIDFYNLDAIIVTASIQGKQPVSVSGPLKHLRSLFRRALL